jgi:hypothetical protein
MNSLNLVPMSGEPCSSPEFELLHFTVSLLALHLTISQANNVYCQH